MGVIFEGGIRVPALISFPRRLPQGEVRNQEAMNIDWFPTLLFVISHTIKRLLMGKASSHSFKIRLPFRLMMYFSLIVEYNGQLMQNDWKLIYNPQDPTLNKPINDTLFLTNIRNNVGENINYAKTNKNKLNELLQLRRNFEKNI